MAYVEWRGGSCRVRWDTGRVNPDTGRKIFDGLSRSDWTEDEALDYGLDREADVRNQRYIPRRDGKLLMRDWAEQWINSVDLAATSAASYRKVINAQILPEWGEKHLSDITAIAVRAWMKRIKAQYKDSYYQNVTLVFGLLMADAVDNKLITSSPMPQRNSRRGKHVKIEEDDDIFPDPVQAIAVAESARVVWGLTGYAFVLTKAYTGMRLGEMRGLRREFCPPNWPASDPDPKRRRESLKRYAGAESMPAIRVQQQLQYVERTATLLPPKYSSHRTLIIPPFLAALLAELLASHNSEWVFPSPSGGSLLQTDFYNYYWRPSLEGAPERAGRWRRPAAPGVPELVGMVPHGVRHGHKTWLDEEDLPRVAVEARMGHELPGVEGTYSHVTPAMEKRIMEALQARWERALKARKTLIDSQVTPSGSPVEDEVADQSEGAA